MMAFWAFYLEEEIRAEMAIHSLPNEKKYIMTSFVVSAEAAEVSC